MTKRTAPETKTEPEVAGRRSRKAASVPAAPRRATPASWRPGQSGNPAGRKPNALAFAERVREKVSPDELIDLALEIARESPSESSQMAALVFLRDAGWSKPPTQQNHLVARVSTSLPVSWAHMTPEQRAAYLDARLVESGDASVIDVDSEENR